MIAYEDLVSALSSWRAAQGLPPTSVNFVPAATGSVDLALPVADPIETSEVEAIEEESVVDEVGEELYSEEVSEIAEDEIAEEAIDSAYAVDGSAELSYEDDADRTAIADDFGAATAFGSDAPEGEYGLNYEDETSYNETPQVPPDAEQAIDADAMEVEAVDAIEAADADAVDMDVDMEMEMDAADEVSADELPVVEEELAAGDPQTEEVDVLDVVDEQEGPTQFGGLEGESTVMGIGVDDLQSPGPSDDPDEQQ